MDNIEITVFDEIKDYKEKIYFFNFRQWAFAILIVAIVVPTYIFLKDKIGEALTSYIVILIAGVLGFIGFVKIHELPAEKIMPYWLRHYFLFSKPIRYITDEEYKLQHQKKKTIKVKTQKIKKPKLSKSEIKEIKRKQKQEKLLKKAKKKYGVSDNNLPNTKTIEKEYKNNRENELSKKLSKLTKEQQDALLKLLER